MLAHSANLAVQTLNQRDAKDHGPLLHNLALLGDGAQHGNAARHR